MNDISEKPESFVPAVEHRIPEPPARVGNQYLDRWNKLFAPYPWVWCDEMCYAYALAYIDQLILHDRIADEMQDEQLVTMNDNGNIASHPLLKHTFTMSGGYMRSLQTFEMRVIALAPRYNRVDENPAWKHIPHVGRGRSGLDAIEGQVVKEQEPDKSHLLLGGKRAIH